MFMFERYTERARRVLFFARYEASQFGSMAIESEHLLLAVLRESRGLTLRLFQQARKSPEEIRQEVTSRMPLFREKISTSIEIPFGGDAKRVLVRAVEESDGLKHSYIGTEHLLLAMLRDPQSPAGSILASAGLEYDSVRSLLITLLQGALVNEPQASPITIDPSNQVEHLKQLVDQLAQLPSGSPESHALAEHIKRELDGFKPPFTALFLSPP
jgi:ATP-dependent Clp protease ATP-binding subunit ClpA